MKIITIYLLLFCIIKITNAQEISAKYLVSKSIDLIGEEPNNKKVVQLDFDGFLFKKGSIYISYLKPLYLNKYPDGFISSNNSDNNSGTIIWMDSIQLIKYIAIDSLVMRYRSNRLPPEAKIFSNTYRNFDLNYQKWELILEEKNIEGLKCQRAKCFNSMGLLQYDVWFCPDIPIEVNFDGIIGLPGLVIEGECIPLKMKFDLQNYELNAKVSSTQIWPSEFNEGFKTLGPIKKRW